MTFERFFCYFWHFLTLFEYVSPHLGLCGTIFGVILGHLLGAIRGHFGATLASFWHHVRWFWLGYSLGAFWTVFVAHFQAIFTVILRFFYDVLEVEFKIKQNNARKGKNMQTSAKIRQKYAKLCKVMQNKHGSILSTYTPLNCTLPSQHYCVYCCWEGRQHLTAP